MVSVLIPNFNNEKWLYSCIESCIGQGELLHEIIFVDDHSADNSLALLNSFVNKYPGKIKISINPKKGANSARDYAFFQSSGKYVQWLDSDDYLLPGKFENQIKPLLNEEADIVYSDWKMNYWIDGELKNQEIKNYKQYPDFLQELLKDNWTSPNNYLMTYEMAERLSGGIGWNPETKVGQDREYFTMAGILGARFQYVPGVYAVYNKQKLGTISGIEFKKRLELNQELENRFRSEINKSRSIAERKIFEIRRCR